MSASGAPERLLRNLTVQGWFRLVFTVLGLLVVAAVLAVVALTARTRDISDELASSILPPRRRRTGCRGPWSTRRPACAATASPATRFLQPYTSGRSTEQAAAAELRTEIGEAALADLAASSGPRRLADRLRPPLISRARSGPLNGRDIRS